MKYNCGVNIISHRFEWQSSGVEASFAVIAQYGL